MARPQASLAQAADEGPMEAFLHMMRAERGASRNTISAYAADLREISAFLATHRTTFLTCSRRNLEAFFADRAAAGLAANSAARKLSCLKRFTLFLAAEGLRADDPARLIDGAKARRGLPAALSHRRGGPSPYRSPRSRRISNSGRRAPRSTSRLPARTPRLRAGTAERRGWRIAPRSAR